MQYLSDKGYIKVYRHLEDKYTVLDTDVVKLQLDVNGETFFLTDNYVEELRTIMGSLDVEVDLSFTVHINGRTEKIDLDPREDLAEDLKIKLRNYSVCHKVFNRDHKYVHHFTSETDRGNETKDSNLLNIQTQGKTRISADPLV